MSRTFESDLLLCFSLLMFMFMLMCYVYVYGFGRPSFGFRSIWMDVWILKSSRSIYMRFYLFMLCAFSPLLWISGFYGFCVSGFT